MSAATPGSPGLRGWLARPTDLASLAWFRIAFGVLAGAEGYRLVSDDIVMDLWMYPGVRLEWPALAWLPAWTGTAPMFHFLALMPLGLAVATGTLFRASCALLAIGWLYPLAVRPTAFLAEAAFLGVLAGVLACTPANRQLSVDATRRPALRAREGPAWPLLLLRAQLTWMQLSAGLALLNGDWLRGYPLALWLPERAGMPLLGWVHESPDFAVGASWVLAVVLVTGPVALWGRRTRVPALVALSACLLWLSQTFALGAVPWVLLAGNLLFLSPAWPRRCFSWPEGEGALAPRAPGKPALGLAAAWLVAQLALAPLPWVSGGGSAWRAPGYGSPWQLVDAAKGGAVQLTLTDPSTGEQTGFDPSAELTWWQYRRVATHPALLQLYAQRVARRVEEAGRARAQVRALTLVTLNGREPQRLVSPKADLAAVRDVRDAILPLEVPLERQWDGASEWPAPTHELVTRAPEKR